MVFVRRSAEAFGLSGSFVERAKSYLSDLDAENITAAEKLTSR